MTTDLGTLLLILALITVFVVAFKVMQAVFEVITVSLLSAAFYISLWGLFNYSLSINRVLLFAALGATLYVVFSLIASVYRLGISIADIPISIVKGIYEAFKESTEFLNSLRSNEKDEEKSSPDEEVKEVVIDKVQED